MDLEREEEEGHGGEEEGVRQEDYCRRYCRRRGRARLPELPADRNDARNARQNRKASREEGEFCESRDRSEVAELDDDVESAPRVGDLVLEKAAGEGEDAVDRLEEGAERRKEGREEGKEGDCDGECEVDEECDAESETVSDYEILLS